MSSAVVDPDGVQWSVRAQTVVSVAAGVVVARSLVRDARREEGRLLFLAGSVIELVLALVIMPITLSMRVIGRSRSPIEIGRQGEHVGTRHARGFAAAGELRDGLLDDIERGVLPADPQATPP